MSVEEADSVDENPVDDSVDSDDTPVAADMDDTDAGTTHTLDGDAILRLRDLDAGYGDLQILSDVDLDVADGEYVTIVGPNGAGKSTVMKTVFGLTTYMDAPSSSRASRFTGSRPSRSSSARGSGSSRRPTTCSRV